MMAAMDNSILFNDIIRTDENPAVGPVLFWFVPPFGKIMTDPAPQLDPCLFVLKDFDC